MYLAYALYCEGPSDFAYFEVLIPRLIDDVIRDRGVRPVDAPSAPAFDLRRSGRSVDAVAAEACQSKEAILLVFIHADTGGAGQSRTLESRSDAYCQKMQEICGFPPARCVLIRPHHETEAWALAHPAAVLEALGYTGPPEGLGLPADAREAERLADPKGRLLTALRQVRGRRRRDEAALLPTIAQQQSINALRGATSFEDFEGRLTTALQDLGAA